MIEYVFFSFLGVACGYLLGKIAPEELKVGRIYFIILKWVLFSVLVCVIAFSMMFNTRFQTVFLALSVLTFVFLCTKKRIKYEVTPYLLFLIPLLFIHQLFPSLVTSLLFLYGFPVGTLWYHGKEA